MRKEWKRVAVLVSTALPLIFSMFLTGCHSTKHPGTGSLAAVEIKGHTPLEIARGVSQVFQEAGFVPTPLPRNRDMKLQFEKLGSLGGTLVYGDWSSKDIYYRAKINIAVAEPKTYVVTCDAYRVLHRGDPHFEEEHKLSFLKQSGYQELLDKAKANVEAVPKEPSSSLP